jgi:predicted GIY-YIG superfamily endonuclease
MAVYLLHFDPPFKHAKHYLGYADDVMPRVYAHLHGRGARLTQVAKDAGVTMLLVRVWEDGTRKTERTFKRRSHVPTLCPICTGQAVQMPLMPWMPAYVPTVDAGEQDGDGGDAQPSTIDYTAELDEYIDDQLDREDWARGGW